MVLSLFLSIIFILGIVLTNLSNVIHKIYKEGVKKYGKRFNFNLF